MKEVKIFIRGIADLLNFKGIYSAMLLYKTNQKFLYNEIECKNYVKRRRSIEYRSIISAMCEAVSVLNQPCKIIFYCNKDIGKMLTYIDNIDLIDKFNKLISSKHHVFELILSDDNQSVLHEHIFNNNLPKNYNKEILENENKEFIYYIYDYVYRKYYIGTSNNIVRRWREHKRFGTRGYENNTYYIAKKGLYVSMKMNGLNNFLFRIIEICNDSHIAKCKERFWINKLNSIDNGYNVLNSFMQIASMSNELKSDKINTGKIDINIEKIHPDIIKYHEKYIKPLNKNNRKAIDLDKIRTTSWIVFKITSKVTNEYYINCRNKVSVDDIKNELQIRMIEPNVKEGSFVQFIQKHNSLDELKVEILEYIEGYIDISSTIRKWCKIFGTQYVSTNYLRYICKDE